MYAQTLCLFGGQNEETEKILHYFSKGELVLWSLTMIFIIGSFVLFDRENYLALIASVVGGTALVFLAKGNPIGQFLSVVFSILYGIISFTCAYYGEMITYLGMTGPMALFSLISWLKNPYNGNKSEVRVNKISGKEIAFMSVLTVAVTVVFYFILDFFGTANIVTSTISVATSFVAVYLTFRRSPYYAVAYAANDVVLIVLWAMATHDDIGYVSVIICFISFLVNDIYGFVNWRRMSERQAENDLTCSTKGSKMNS